VSHPEDGSTSEELMVAADRAMYQAKSLGKNQISGNPRPRRTTPRLLAAPHEIGEPAPTEPAPTEPVSMPPAPAEPVPSVAAAPVAVATGVPESTAFAIESKANGSNHEAHGEDEPDPADVRRQIAAARRNMDPDHQIRRAMDAFLSSPTSSRAERERSS
jgi:hypothetical protein